MIIQSLPLAFLLGDATPMELFIMGEWIMWPMILVSFVMITVVVERLLFIIRENASREPEVVEKMLEAVERRDIDGALAIGKKSKDFIAKILVYSLTNRDYSMSNAFIRASGQEVGRFQQGMATLDTCVTAAPYLGLLGTDHSRDCLCLCLLIRHLQQQQQKQPTGSHHFPLQQTGLADQRSRQGCVIQK